LRRPAQAAGAYQRPLGQLRKLAAIATDQHIPGIFPLGDGSYREPIRQHRRDILHAVDRQIHGTIQQSVFQFLDKESLAADLGERHIEDLITGGLDDSQLDPTSWPPSFEFSLHPLALRQRQQAAAGPNAQQSVHQPIDLNDRNCSWSNDNWRRTTRRTPSCCWQPPCCRRS